MQAGWGARDRRDVGSEVGHREADTVDYDPFDDAMKDDPFPVYARLRAESPVHYLERFDCWALSLFEDIWNAGQQPDLYPSPGPAIGTIISRADDEETSGVQSLFGLNPPLHTRLRKALARLYSPRGVSRLEAHVRRRSVECIEAGRERGSLDVVEELGLCVSSDVASLLIGLPLEDSQRLTQIVRRFFTRVPGVEGMPPDALAASEQLHDYLLEAVRERRKRGTPGDGSDALDVFMSFRGEGGGFDDEGVANHLQILVVGGTETLPKVFAGGVIQLHRHPDQRARLVAAPSLIPTAFMEIARYEMPTQFLSRGIARDHELRGQQLREGQGVLFLYRAANRDEAEFPDADRFDVARNPPRILSFGHGTHVCVGQHAARLEARVMYEELLAAAPGYGLEESEVVPERSEFVAGYVSVPIHFEPI
ncbi:MAG: cytochrome P450 [Myxococcales bacterium]|nr:cytochrome P450 [Myxococcales bacterium]